MTRDGTETDKMSSKQFPLLFKSAPPVKVLIFELVKFEVGMEPKGQELMSEMLLNFFPLRKSVPEKAIAQEVVPVLENLESFTDQSVAHHGVLTPSKES